MHPKIKLKIPPINETDPGPGINTNEGKKYHHTFKTFTIDKTPQQLPAKINMAQLNIYHVQAKITAYLDLEDLLQGETSDDQNITKLQTLQKIIKYLLANEDKWLTKDAAILYDIADNIVKNHYLDY